MEMAPQERNSLPCEEPVPPSCELSNRTAPPVNQCPMESVTNDQMLMQRLSPAETKDSAAYTNKGYSLDSSDVNQNIDLNGNPEKGNGKLPEVPTETELTDFDDLLPHIGEFGLYQQILFLLMIPFTFFVSFVYFSQIFLTLVPEDYWCMVPELSNLTRAERVALSIPHGENGQPAHCVTYDVDWVDYLNNNKPPFVPDPKWTQKSCGQGWEFNLTDVPYHTISTELGWVCDQDNRPAMAQAIFFCGAIVGGLIFGWIADKYGRIPALVGTNLVGFIAGVATAFCNSFWLFCVCRFFVGLAFDNCFTMMYILVLEYVGPKWRTFVANMSIALFFTLASCLLPWIAWFLADWRWLAVITSAPLLLAIATPWCVPESARWLVSQGYLEKALVILKKFERINKSKIPEKVLKDFTDSCMKIQKEEETAATSYSVLDLFKTPRLRKIVILLILIWMVISLVFDGHVRNVGSLGLNIFVTFTIAAATELPADTFLTLVLDRWGRRWLACGSMVFSGLFSLLAVAVPAGGYSAGLAIMGRFAVNISYNIGLQYAAELLPTVVRAQGVALIHIMGYVASILAPFIVYLVTYHQSLPLLILGTLGVIGGLLSLLLPETVDKVLPQTLQDGENFGKDQKFWQFPCLGEKQEHIEHPGFYLRRSSIGMSMRSASSRRSSVFARTGVISTGRTSIRGSIRAESMRRRTVSMSSNGGEIP